MTSKADDLSPGVWASGAAATARTLAASPQRLRQAIADELEADADADELGRLLAEAMRYGTAIDRASIIAGGSYAMPSCGQDDAARTAMATKVTKSHARMRHAWIRNAYRRHRKKFPSGVRGDKRCREMVAEAVWRDYGWMPSDKTILRAIRG